MILTGGVLDSQHVERAAAKAEGIVGKLLVLFDHVWHELESGDPMTWLAFIAAVVFVFGGIGLIVGLWRGSITFNFGRK